MRGKHLNSGIRGGLWDRKHYERMGNAIWLFGWLVLVHRQTTQKLSYGAVLRWKPLTYDDIAEDTGYEVRTIRKWMRLLVSESYVAVRYTTYKRMMITVLNAKKFKPVQLELGRGDGKADGDQNVPVGPISKRPNRDDIASQPGRFKKEQRKEQRESMENKTESGGQTEAFEEWLTRLFATYGREPNEDQVLVYTMCLGDLPERDLSEAMIAAIKRTARPFPPSPGEILEALELVRESRGELQARRLTLEQALDDAGVWRRLTLDEAWEEVEMLSQLRRICGRVTMQGSVGR